MDLRATLVLKLEVNRELRLELLFLKMALSFRKESKNQSDSEKFYRKVINICDDCLLKKIDCHYCDKFYNNG